MIFRTPDLPADVVEALSRLDELRDRLRARTRGLDRWLGSLRRLAMARAVDSSTAIEGYRVPLEDAAAIVSHESVPAPGETARQAVACYGRAMDHVAVMAEDPVFEWSTRVMLDLHFETCYFQPEEQPGRWRLGPVSVTQRDGTIAYRGPDAEVVPELMAEVAQWLAAGDTAVHAVVRAAMAHLHVVSVHPFSDGNGRVARIVQSLVLARGGLLAPEFASIEEYLGEHTAEYYAALQEVHGPRYDPTRDATAWVRFCVVCHLAQAQRRLREVETAARRWQASEDLVAARGWPERLVIALERALTGYLDRAGYVAEADVAPMTANLDFRRLADAGLIVQEGRGRSTRYRASASLTDHISAALGETT